MRTGAQSSGMEAVSGGATTGLVVLRRTRLSSRNGSTVPELWVDVCRETCARTATHRAGSEWVQMVEKLSVILHAFFQLALRR